jgi:hypothetical protein
MALIITSFAPTTNGSVHPPASRLVPRINGLAVRWWGTADDTGGKWYNLSMITPPVGVKR